MFDSERWLDMEHTSTEPAHRHKAQKLRGKIGGITPPISGIYKTKQALVEAMNPYAYGGWTSIQKEVDAKYQLIIKAIKNKIDPTIAQIKNCKTPASDVPMIFPIISWNGFTDEIMISIMRFVFSSITLRMTIFP